MMAATLPVPVKYAAVALLCAILHNIIVIAFDWINIHYALSTLVAFPLCLAVGYVFQSRWTFVQILSLPAFWRYAVPTLANYPASVALLYVFTDLMHLPMIIASPVVTALLVTWNFAVTRWALRSDRGLASSVS